MFVNHKQANAIREHLNNQAEKKKLTSFLINKHEHHLMGQIVTVWSPFMDHFAVNHDGEFVPPEDMQ